MSDNVNLPFDHGAIARQVIDNVDVDKLLSNLQGYRDFAAKNRRYEMANDLQNAIMVIAAMRYELKKGGIRMSDMVHHPKHYQKEGRPECIQEMFEKFGAVAVYWFSVLSSYKYRYRAGDKDGNSAEQDEAKSVWYDNEAEKMRALGAPSGWVKCSDRLPDNAYEPGAFCPRCFVKTRYGVTEGWFNPDYDVWFVLIWYYTRRYLEHEISLERGDVPKVCTMMKSDVTHWMPLPDMPKEVSE